MRRRRDERGGMAVIAALLIVPLLGVGALVIDVGQLVQERRELQNGADAAALAVAKDCGSGDCLDFTAMAEAFADPNADDADSNIDEVCGEGPGLSACGDPPVVPEGVTGYVRVIDSTREVASGTDQITYTLARVFGLTGGTVRASAVAAWGSIGAASTIPITFSTCDFDPSDVQEGLPPYTGTPQIILFHTTAPLCPGIGPSGADAPGGFGWLDEGDDCEADIEVGGWVTTDPGNGAADSGCVFTDWQNQTLLIPIYDEVSGTGNNIEYRIEKFAAFYIVGYRFPGKSFGTGCGPSGPSGPKGPKGSNEKTCLVGYFRGFVFPGEFGGEDTGAVAVKMVG